MGAVKLGLRLPRQPLFIPFQDPRKKYQPGSHPAWGSLGEPYWSVKLLRGEGIAAVPLPSSLPGFSQLVMRCTPLLLQQAPLPHCIDLSLSPRGEEEPLPSTEAHCSLLLPTPRHCSNLFPSPPSLWPLPLASGSTLLSLLSFSHLFHPRRSQPSSCL